MKFTPDTLAVLKNFSTINQSIVIAPGSLIGIRSPESTVFAVAEVPEVFDRDLAIYDLPQFLNVFSMFQDPVLDLSRGLKACIREGKTVVNYTFAEPSLIKKAPNGIVDPPAITSFELSTKLLQQILKGAGIMNLPQIRITGDGKYLYIGATDAESPSTNTYDVEIGETSEIFTAFVDVTSFKHLLRDYTVTVTNRLLKFESQGLVKVTYWTALNQNSKM